MKQRWTEEELIAHFTLSPDEWKLLEKRTTVGRLGFAVLLKFHQYIGRFPTGPQEIPKDVVVFIAKQLQVEPEKFSRYHWHGREAKHHRALIRNVLGFHPWNRQYAEELIKWLCTTILPHDFTEEHLNERALQHLRMLKQEPPTPKAFTRLLRSALNRWEEQFFHTISDALSPTVKNKMDMLFRDNESTTSAPSHHQENIKAREITVVPCVSFRELKAPPRKLNHPISRI